jgi:FkbM family methyltransferase
MSERRAIVMISIGNRPWSSLSSRTFEHYCAEVGADMHLVKQFPSPEDFPFPEMPDSPGRKHKLAYACKAYFAWKFMEIDGYDRVVVVDDTCCVRPGADNIFESVPSGVCGYTGTSGLHAEQSFNVIRAFLTKNKLDDIEYNTRYYMNSGVMLYDRSFKDCLHWKKICEAADLLYAKYPNQTLTYYLLRRGNVPMQRMSKSFNSIPAMSLSKAGRSQVEDISDHLTDNIFIYHITGAFKKRGEIVSQLAGILLSRWDPSFTSEVPHHEVLASEAPEDEDLSLTVAANPPRDDLSEKIEESYNTHAPHFSYINGGLRRIAVDPADRRARYQLLRHRINYTSKMQALVLAIQAHLKTDIFVDVGVNYGECLFSTPLFSNSKIIGFEANPGLFGYIEKSMMYNDDLKDVTLVKKGVSDSVGTSKFFIDKQWSGQSTIVDRGKRRASRIKEVTIETTTLDVESETWGDWKRALIKVDVEGLEPQVLAGASKLNQCGRDLIYLLEFDSTYMNGTDRASPPAFFKELAGEFEVFVASRGKLTPVATFEDLRPFARESGRLHCDLLLLKVGPEAKELFKEHFLGKSIQKEESDRLPSEPASVK